MYGKSLRIHSIRAASTRCGPCVCEGSGGAGQTGISGLLLHAFLLSSRPVVSLLALAITGCVLVGSFRALVVVALLPCPLLVIACHAGAAAGKASFAAWAGGAGGESRLLTVGACRAGCAGSPRRRVRSRRALRAAFSIRDGILARTAVFADTTRRIIVLAYRTGYAGSPLVRRFVLACRTGGFTGTFARRTWR